MKSLETLATDATAREIAREVAELPSGAMVADKLIKELIGHYPELSDRFSEYSILLLEQKSVRIKEELEALLGTRVVSEVEMGALNYSICSMFAVDDLKIYLEHQPSRREPNVLMVTNHDTYCRHYGSFPDSKYKKVLGLLKKFVDGDATLDDLRV